jgi:hypothetical protein
MFFKYLMFVLFAIKIRFHITSSSNEGANHKIELVVVGVGFGSVVVWLWS